MARSKRNTVPEPETTGHEWDGIYELNKPLPKWWLYIFYATIPWSIGYWLLMPSWPLLSSYTNGLLGYSQREKLAEQIEAARVEKSVYREKIAASDLAEINEDPELRRFAHAGGAADFVFQGDKLAPVLEALATAKRTRSMAFQNFAVAGVYNVICVPLAMAGLVTPLIAAIVMSTSSILVVANAARLAGRGRP